MHVNHLLFLYLYITTQIYNIVELSGGFYNVISGHMTWCNKDLCHTTSIYINKYKVQHSRDIGFIQQTKFRTVFLVRHTGIDKVTL